MKSSRRHTRSLFAISALALATASSLAQTVPLSAAEGGKLWFIELAGAPEADGNSKAAVKAEKDSFRQAAAAAGVRFKERRAFDTLFNGFSVEVGTADRAKLARLPGFKAMYPIEVVYAPKPEAGATGAAPDMATAVAMTGANLAQASGWTGAGVKVGIIDSGIDIDHPDFGGGGVAGGTPFPSARVRYGYDFVGDTYNADPTSASYNPNPSPDDNPDDCGGHGTHVAGIVGANGTVKGVAPGVTLGAYRVFGCAGSTESDIILAALERAHADGMQVVNQSLGASRQWPQYPTAVASSRLAKLGVVMVASIGNSGPGGGAQADGIYAAGAPGVGEKVIGVASYDNSHVFLSYATANGQQIGFAPMTFSAPIPTSGSGVLVDAGLACGALPAGSLSGSIALVARGSCTFGVKAVNAIAAGADAVVISNNVPGVLTGTLGTPLANPKPVVGISLADGIALRAMAAPVVLNWTGLQASFTSPTGNLISGFSSFGLAADLSLKPNIGAPGGQIYSTYPLESGGYATLSGTSMSSPHVAGGVALLLEAKPKTSVADVKTLIQNSADPKAWNGNPGLGFLDNVHRQGAGMLDVPGAIGARAMVEPSELSLGESQAGVVRRQLQIKNLGNAGVTYDVSHEPALATGSNTFTQLGLQYRSAPATVTFNKTALTVQAASNQNLELSIAAPAGTALEDRGIYGGYIVLKPRDGGATLRVPYAGFKGDYQAIQALTPTANGFPWLAKLGAGGYSNQPAGASFSLVGDDIPYVLLHLDHHAEEVLLEALDASGGAVVGRVSLDQWVSRNSAPAGAFSYFSYVWDGKVFKRDSSKPNQVSAVPNGSYKLRLTVKKALADKNNPAHLETWTSPVITLARP